MSDISLVNVCKTYKGGHSAVKNFTLDIKDRELVIFVGPSGCGKSTTLRMIAGLEDITSGELWIDDCLMNMVEPKNRDLSMMFQNYALYPHMTVYENMAFGLRVHKTPAAEIDARVREVAGFIGCPSMNFLDADVWAGDGSVWLEGQGWRLPLRGYKGKMLLDRGYAGKRITLGIRPEDFHEPREGEDGSRDGWIGIQVSIREMLGSEVLLHGQVGKWDGKALGACDIQRNEGDGLLSAKMPASCKVKAGQFLRLYVDMSQIKLFVPGL